MTTFSEFGVPAVLTTALADLGITTPFPIQAATLPDSLAGRDVLGRGRTGSGKTYAFVLPVLARLASSKSPRRPGRPRALILAPTRELATQIEATMAPLAAKLGLRTLTVFGGVGANPQIKGLKAGVDVLVACPGRLDDHLRNGHASLDSIEITVLDEADHMADLGFLPVVRRLMDQTPREGQRMLFSATLDNGVDVLVKRFLHKPVTHSVDSATEAPVQMDHHVLHVRGDDRFPVLVDLLAAPGRTVVFTRTKRRAKVLTRQLNQAGVPAVELHGNLAQNARNRNLAAFSDGTAETLVATDIAARGIHVDDVALVIHADPPVEHKAYLHRSGRTARAGARGTVVTLMTDDQQSEVRDLTRKAGVRPTTSRTRPGDPLLSELAPGERVFVAPRQAAVEAPASSSASSASSADGDAPAGAGRSRRGRGRGRGAGRPAESRPEQVASTTRHGEGRAQRPRTEQGAGGRQSQGSGGGRGRRGGTGSTPVHTSQSRGSGSSSGQARPASAGGAAAFSAGTRVGGRRSGR
ncbi:DEAD/DEAH box helicase [Paractinoplanes atraurantiacus]|uniref:Superfamily II DNA and RNA helicase n=1 Tax=Paractinoplanes atraurantiacus TaxID=1036182 RepID=A0A285JJY4_9ACTN|nr:DEAD/DEAH box helicase [Actinoplanes atraurantiacus]SNY60584.1 Superfamily II DNA and RNA helicase [Actinoplanes atraurantiacus]